MLYGAYDTMLYFPVDKDHALAQEYVPHDLVTLRECDVLTTREDIQAREIILDDLADMMHAALKDGITLAVTSGYRSYERQEELFAYWKKQHIKKGLSEEEAEQKTNTYSAYPGHSEHQLGTALDIVADVGGSSKKTTNNKRAWQWLYDNSEKYGFVLSYPEGKTELTGYIHEPWHFRWIGKKHARNLKKKKYKDPSTSTTSTRYLHKIYHAQ
jgi:D-alanyl-D-alanine carboxypeptidase